MYIGFYTEKSNLEVLPLKLKEVFFSLFCTIPLHWFAIVQLTSPLVIDIYLVSNLGYTNHAAMSNSNPG